MNETKTFKISPDFIGRVASVVARLNKRADKLNVVPVFFTVGPEHLESVEGRVVKLCDVTISLNIPRLPDWRFLATLEHTQEGNIIRTFPAAEGLDLSPYRTCAPTCQHCNQIRNRRDTFVVEHEAKGRLQVGRDCLGDFLGLGISAADAAAFAEYISQLADFSSWIADPSAMDSDFGGGEGGGRGDGVSTLEFLSHVAECARRWGFRTRKQADEMQTDSTRDEALSAMFPPKGKPGLELSDAAKADAVAAIAWGKSIEVKSDFDHNLCVIAHAECITFRDCGIAAYLIQAHRRALEIKVERAARPVSKHFGEVGKRVKGAKLIYKGSASFDSQYGETFIHRFLTPEGDQAIWKTGNGINDDIGTGLTVDYSVKAHGDWKGNLQTVLTRVKVL